MTHEQRDEVRVVLAHYAQRYPVQADQALDAIAAIMAQKWLPVAGLVRDERRVAMVYQFPGEAAVVLTCRANRIHVVEHATHYCELPTALPPKPEGDDAR